MTKHHINLKTGEVSPCEAKVRDCPLGGAEIHGDSAADARKIYERMNEKDSLSTLKKNSDPMESYTPGYNDTLIAPSGIALKERKGFHMAWSASMGPLGVSRAVETKEDAIAVAELTKQKKILDEANLKNKAGRRAAVEALLRMEGGRDSYLDYVGDALGRKVDKGQWETIAEDVNSLLEEYKSHDAFQEAPYSHKRDLQDLLKSYVGWSNQSARNVDFLLGMKELAGRMGVATKKKTERNFPSGNYGPLLDSDGDVISPSRLRG